MFEAPVAASSLAGHIDAAAKEIEGRVIAWRRDIHANPELGNREFRTAGIVAEHLKRLGLDEVRTGVAHTGVVGLLKGALPGPVVALRADMDALPVAEEVDVPFASKVKAQWNGESVGVMHACGTGFSSAPSATIIFAPPSSPSGGSSSAGWKMNLTEPRSWLRSPASTSATPIRMATWASWPQACMTPTGSPFHCAFTFEANGTSTSSATGSASMSARSATTGPGRPPSSTPTTPVTPTPSVTW